MPYSTTTVDAAAWDNYVRGHPRGHVLQLSAWGDLKRNFGWETERVVITDDENAVVGGALLLFRALPVSRMAYLPMGPYADNAAVSEMLWAEIHRTIKQRQPSAFLKWEPGIFRDAPEPDYPALKFRPSEQTIQPPNTILIDINGDDDTIMARMNQGTRRKIRKSLKTDVQYLHADSDGVERFGEMMQVTGERNEFGVHDPAYYRLAYQLFVQAGDAALILAEHEGDLLAGLMVFAVGGTAWYLYGASSNIKRNLMAAYGVQWQAIQWAKARGCHTYDMWGVPDASADELEAHFQERTDGLWGVYGFKRGWGGDVVRSAGAWDRVYKPLVYQGYRAALRLRG